VSDSGLIEDGGVIEPGVPTRLRRLAGWFLVAHVIVGIAWGFLHLF
jgi:hypothetical protein